jgi:HSP20 family molecular chaperone IbpA
VSVNVMRAEDMYELYVLVPGLLQEEVKVTCDNTNCVTIQGTPKELDNPWKVALNPKP